MLTNLVPNEHTCMQMVREGKTWDEIGDHLGMLPHSAYKMYRKVMAKYGQATLQIVEEIKLEEQDKLDQAEAMWDDEPRKVKQTTGLPLSERLANLDKVQANLNKIWERRTKLS